jgi:hypothetical protein
MSEQRVSIDPATLFDNVDERQVEFAGEIGGESRQFALRYDVMEALVGLGPDQTDIVPQVQHHLARIEQLAARALARDTDQELVVISENDLA